MAFICNHCPYVKHVAAGLAILAKEYQKRGVAVVAINANDVANYPDDSPAKMAEEVKIARLHLPVSLRRNARSREGLRGRLHAGFLCLRQGPQAGLSRPDGFQPSEQRDARHRRRFARRARCRAGRQTGFRRSKSPASAATSNGSRATNRRISVRWRKDCYSSGFIPRIPARPIGESRRLDIRGRAIRRRLFGRRGRNRASNR